VEYILIDLFHFKASSKAFEVCCHWLNINQKTLSALLLARFIGRVACILSMSKKTFEDFKIEYMVLSENTYCM